MRQVRGATQNLQLLSELLLVADSQLNVQCQPGFVARLKAGGRDAALCQRAQADLEALAASNHVIVRSFEPLRQILDAAGNTQGAEWAASALDREGARINYALDFLREICAQLEKGGCPVTVIKSLDHWPDLGSDLDLYTDADAAPVIPLMSTRFHAKAAARSWGDRLADKWNFIVPGLPELVEIHMGRLGQTGEQTIITRSLSERTRLAKVGVHLFPVPAPEDRIVISTLQRMYRHFYIRLCDVVDNARLLDSGVVDFDYLRSLGLSAGLWEGIATYLTIISEYVEMFRGRGLPLPCFITAAAKFGTNQVRFGRDFLRIPILPHSLNLYAAELKSLLLKGDLRNGLRLSLLPCLATAAALELKITGSDKGIW